MTLGKHLRYYHCKSLDMLLSLIINVFLMLFNCAIIKYKEYYNFISFMKDALYETHFFVETFI